MKNISSVKDLRELVKSARLASKSIGFVPTMGYLHDGHLSLMKRAREENDLVIVSIFVNPTQFGPNEDLDSYPRDLERDLELCKSVGVDIVFSPEVSEMYMEGASTYVVTEGNITKKLCGASREGHFKGVTTVVTKLFNMVGPDRAYFGQKDAQQVAVIEKMVRELNSPVEIVSCPIVREKDGLAMSSRNFYLSPQQRVDALILNQSLFEAERMIKNGEKSAEAIKAFITENIMTYSYIEIDYVEVVSAVSLEDVEVLEGDILIALAAKVGKPRLIDNIRIQVK